MSTFTNIIPSESNDRCFICLEEHNLKQANLCCGNTVYHTQCLNDYCTHNANPVCPICKKNIKNKFTVVESENITYEINYSIVKLIFFIIFLGTVCTMYYFASTNVTQLVDKSNLSVYCWLFYAFPPILMKLIFQYLEEGYSDDQILSKLVPYQKLIFSISIFVNPFILLITSIISFVRPDILSFFVINYIFYAIASFVLSIMIIYIIARCLYYALVEIIVVCRCHDGLCCCQINATNLRKS